jgi:2,4-dienoyl-CoA reductase-like NADH-dependent reductase (Old Yellow Enzyme family)
MFKSGKIGSLEVINRFIRSATAEFAANPDGTIIDEYIDLYSNLARGEIGLARGEIGLIIQGHLFIMDEGKAHKKMSGIAHEFHLDGLKKLVHEIHNIGKGSRIVAQLNHGGFRSVSKKAPSIPEGKNAQIMTEEDIESVITNFGIAASRAKKIGYDAVQIHAAHEYLVSQFLSSRLNQRHDSWGGNLENRANLLLSVYREIRSKVGSNYPVLVKINGSDEPKEGFPVEEGATVSRWLADEGLDLIEISGNRSVRTEFDSEAYFKQEAQIIKNKIGDMPLSVVGGNRNFKAIQQLREEFADFISFSRPFIREPDLVLKLKNGKEKADCISCNKCFTSPTIITCMDEREKKT